MLTESPKLNRITEKHKEKKKIEQRAQNSNLNKTSGFELPIFVE